MRTSNLQFVHTVQALAYAQEGIEVMRFLGIRMFCKIMSGGVCEGSVGGSGFSVKPGEKPLTLFIQMLRGVFVEMDVWKNNKGFFLHVILR